MKRDRESTIKYSANRPVLRLVLFLIAVALAVWGFTTAILNIGTRNKGFQAVQASSFEEMPYYASEYSMMYYIDAEGLASKAQYNEVQRIYSQALQKAAILLDAQAEHDGYVNLATLNRNQGRAFQVDPWLYAVLQDAYASTQSSDNYNVFAGAVHSEWSSILILDEPEEFDPAFNSYEAQRISSLAKGASPENFTLELGPGNMVTFSSSKAYQDLCAEYEVTSPALDVNVLKQAYTIQLVVDQLTSAGYEAFHITSACGLCVNADKDATHGYAQYAEDGSISNIMMSGECTFIQARAFDVFNDITAYTLAGPDGKMLYRSRYFDVSTGEQGQSCHSCTVTDNSRNSAVKAMKECLNAFSVL